MSNKGKKYRSFGDISHEILVAATEKNRSRTQLMYLTFTSFAQLKDYVEYLVEKGLLDHLDDDTYITSEKGREFIKINEELKKLVND